MAIWVLGLILAVGIVTAVWFFLGWIPGAVALFLALLVLGGLWPNSGGGGEFDGGPASTHYPDYGMPQYGDQSSGPGDQTAG